MTITLINGDCLVEMAKLEANSVDSIITDPPYGLEFMGKEWDKGVPGEAYWKEALRVAKPGATLLCFGGDRTHHRLMVAIEDAGWEIRTCIYWIFGSGFPKSHDISKAIDREAGAEREVVGTVRAGFGNRNGKTDEEGGVFLNSLPEELKHISITAPATPTSALWSGWGTALKPAAEIIVVAMKPCDGTFAHNALTWGVAGLWIDGGRVPTDIDSEPDTGSAYYLKRGQEYPSSFEAVGAFPIEHKPNMSSTGRWPANLVLGWPEDEYVLKDNVTPEQLRELAGWMDENPEL